MTSESTYMQKGLWDSKEQPYKINQGLFRKKVLVIAGPTATGKTRLSLMIAKAIGGEIISCDSMQVYEGTDIGTAKPTLEERREVPHHLIDVRSIKESFNVVNFYEEAMDAYRKVLAQDHVPILVGGAGFYMRTFLYGPPKGPSSDPMVRDKLEEDFEKFGAEMLYSKLKEFDPDYAASITLQDRQKIIRALEIITLTHKKVSEIPKPSQEDIPQDMDLRCWFIHHTKPILYERIEARCDEMLCQGLVEEVIRLKADGLEHNSSAAHSIGYRQCLAFLESPQKQSDWDTFITAFKKASRNYAKRQFTWFRREPLFRWLNLSEMPLDQAAELIIQDLERH